MSDKKITDGDEAAENADKPMEDPRVRVRVRPVKHKTKGRPREERRKAQKQNEENRKLAEKVEDNLERQVEEKVEEAGARPGGTRKDQYKAADKVVDDAAGQVSRRKINEIDVTVEDSRDGHRTQAIPHEGEPPPDEED